MSQPATRGLAASFLAVLAGPFFAHAALVLLSALGAYPLAGRAAPIAIAIGSVAMAWVFAGSARSNVSAAAAEPAPAELGAFSTAAARSLWLAAAASVLLALCAAIAFPVTAYDALAYRLPVIAQWLDHGRIAWVASDDPVRNGYPLGQEALSALIAAATGSMRFAAATSYLYLLGGALAVWLLSEACGVRRLFARCAAALLLLAPIAILNAPSGYADAAFAGASVALFCSAALLAASERPRAWLGAAAGMAAAHVLALKGTGLGFVGVVSIALAVVLGRRALRADAAALRALAAFALCALPGLFWTLRDLVHTGNPFWPIAIKLGGRTLLRGVDTIDKILDVVHNTPPELASVSEFGRILRTWFEWRGPAVDCDDRFAGLGLAWPLFALPAIAAQGLHGVRAWRSKRATRATAAYAWVLVLTGVCFVLQPMRWWSRYTLWLWAAGALAIALQLEQLAASGRRRWLAAGIAALALLASGEGALAVTHAKDANRAVARWLSAREGKPPLFDARRALNARHWVAPEFWELGIERSSDVCRGWWKPSTDNANLDGVLAQLEERPRMHVVYDDRPNWPHVRERWRAIGCPQLLLLHGSPVLPFAERDPSVSVERAVAFDPIFIVRPRTTAALSHFEDLQP